MLFIRAVSFFLIFFCSACAGSIGKADSQETELEKHFLALGDSYTIGASVSVNFRWPAQLAALIEDSDGEVSIGVTYRATTGWTTGNLLSSLKNSPLSGTYDMVSLLIGVNNQYQNLDFSVYQEDVPQLIDMAIAYAGGDASRVFVLSIPDYAYTPFGQSLGEEAQTRISTELAEYNDWMRTYIEGRSIPFINITPITQNGLAEPDLVAGDGLHPSGEAYRLFAELVFAGVEGLWNR